MYGVEKIATFNKFSKWYKDIVVTVVWKLNRKSVYYVRWCHG